MNFDHLYSEITKIWLNLTQQKKIILLNFLKYQHYWLNWKKKKLKLGAIIFEINEIFLGEFLIYEIVDIRYIKQDNTQTDELNLTNRLNKLNWKWDFDHVFALIILISLIINYNYLFLYTLYYNYFFVFKLITQTYNIIFYFLIKTNFSGLFFNFFQNFDFLNLTLLELLNFLLINYF